MSSDPRNEAYQWTSMVQPQPKKLDPPFGHNGMIGLNVKFLMLNRLPVMIFKLPSDLLILYEYVSKFIYICGHLTW